GTAARCACAVPPAPGAQPMRLWRAAGARRWAEPGRSAERAARGAPGDGADRRAAGRPSDPIWDSRVIRASQTHSLHFPLVTSTSPPTDLLDEARRALEPAFRLDHLVALSAERALYHGWDRVLKRPVAVRVHLGAAGNPGRAWFLRETETLAALDHPAIRHVYAAGEM